MAGLSSLAAPVGQAGVGVAAANNITVPAAEFTTDSVVGKIGFGSIAGLPTSVRIRIVSFLVGLGIQSPTFFGRDVYATGGSLTAARPSGAGTERTVITVYALCSLQAPVESAARRSACSSACFRTV